MDEADHNLRLMSLANILSGQTYGVGTNALASSDSPEGENFARALAGINKLVPNYTPGPGREAEYEDRRGQQPEIERPPFLPYMKWKLWDQHRPGAPVDEWWKMPAAQRPPPPGGSWPPSYDPDSPLPGPREPYPEGWDAVRRKYTKD